MLVEAARAKVNLYLHIVGRRADGYHLLDSLAVFPGAADRLFAQPSEQLSLVVCGPFGEGLAATDDNLVLRAARALANETGVAAGAALRLEKNLPVASGIGGGSADAAATLRLLVRLWGIDVDAGTLADLAAGLGADVPVCLASLPARMSGVGEILMGAPDLPACGMVLINPGVAVSTPAVFRARKLPFQPAARLPEGWGDVPSMTAALSACSNDLEAPARSVAPQIGAVLAWLQAQDGCLLARMSGSGATCFGLFAEAAEATSVARRSPAQWWAWGGTMAG